MSLGNIFFFFSTALTVRKKLQNSTAVHYSTKRGVSSVFVDTLLLYHEELGESDFSVCFSFRCVKVNELNSGGSVISERS
jgi:hypothetical protein